LTVMCVCNYFIVIYIYHLIKYYDLKNIKYL
jgi:hypothetical protein